MSATILRWDKTRRWSPYENLLDGIINRNVGSLAGITTVAQFFRGISEVSRTYNKTSIVSRMFEGVSKVMRTIKLEDRHG